MKKNKLEKVSARKLLAKYEKLEAQRAKLGADIIALGFGHIPINTLFQEYMNFSPVAADYALYLEECAIREEAQRRYGANGLFNLRYR